MVGETISHYRIIEKLGEGGMGVVYKAEDTKLLRTVALKFVSPHALSSEDSRERFIQEARAAAACDHPHICTIYEIDEADGRTFIAMAYVEGRGLDEMIAAGPIDPDRAIDVATQVADGLAAAHAKDVVHRDIKPANIMIGADGQARIMDFGLAETSGGTGLTRPALAAGTIAYMSPERTRGLEFDHRTDIWSLGVILYEMLTGELPFKGGSDQALIYSLFHDDRPSIDEAGIGAPPGLAAVVARALASHPEDRYQDIREMLADLRALMPAGAGGRGRPAVPAHAGNLPVQLSRFIGRKEEMELALHLLGENRFLTLTGAGGCGKTRMAIEVAEALLPELPDGAWFADLAPLSDPALVPQAVAEALGVKESPDESVTETVAGHLESKTALIVLDNCEHLLLACAALAERLLRTCPNLRLLATSQEAIGISGEVVYQVLTLAVPPARPGIPLERIARTEAIALFVDRAKAAKTQFALTEENAPAVVQVVRRLDGIPLALELAAARVKALPVEEIAKRLDDRFRLLTSGSRTSLPRHQTLRALVDWSYEHLEPPEQTLFRRLSVYAGGWTLESAEAVCAGDGIEPFDVLDLMSRLVEKSLVEMQTSTELEVTGTRYRMLETLRAYARERLREEGEEAELRRRHRDHFVGVAEAAEPHLQSGREQTNWLARLGSEYGNLRAALDACIEAGDAEAGLRVAGSLGRYWTYRGHWTVGRNTYAKLLGDPGGQARTGLRAKALSWAGVLAYKQADYAQSRTLHEESLAIRRELDDQHGISESLHNLAMTEFNDPARARALYDESLTISTGLGDERQMARTINNLAILALGEGAHEQARSLFEEGLALRRKIGDREGEALTLGNLGVVSQIQGDYERARSVYEESLSLARDLCDPHGVAWSLYSLGKTAVDTGDHGGARAFLSESLGVAQDLGDRRTECWVLSQLGRGARLGGDLAPAREYLRRALTIAHDLGDHEKDASLLLALGLVSVREGDVPAARGHLGESLTTARERGDGEDAAGALEGFAALAAVEGDPGRALRLLAASQALRREIGQPLAPSETEEIDAYLSAARAELGEERAAEEAAAGAGLDVEAAARLALTGGDRRESEPDS